MADDAAQRLQRRVMRLAQESAFINTINVADRVKIHFVWFPGPQDPSMSLVDPILGALDAAGNERTVEYLWQRTGLPDVRRTMNTGTIVLTLPPGGKGTLTVFDTSWELTRAANGVTLDGKTTMNGVQQRLDRLGYHLRTPGQVSPGISGAENQATEAAVIAFQADYRPGPVGGPSTRLFIRGEWNSNPELPGWLDVNLSATNGFVTQGALDAVAKP